MSRPQPLRFAVVIAEATVDDWTAAVVFPPQTIRVNSRGTLRPDGVRPVITTVAGDLQAGDLVEVATGTRTVRVRASADGETFAGLTGLVDAVRLTPIDQPPTWAWPDTENPDARISAVFGADGETNYAAAIHTMTPPCEWTPTPGLIDLPPTLAGPAGRQPAVGSVVVVSPDNAILHTLARPQRPSGDRYHWDNRQEATEGFDGRPLWPGAYRVTYHGDESAWRQLHRQLLDSPLFHEFNDTAFTMPRSDVATAGRLPSAYRPDRPTGRLYGHNPAGGNRPDMIGPHLGVGVGSLIVGEGSPYRFGHRNDDRIAAVTSVYMGNCRLVCTARRPINPAKPLKMQPAGWVQNFIVQTPFVPVSNPAGAYVHAEPIFY